MPEEKKFVLSPESTESVRIDRNVLAAYRYLSERTGLPLAEIIARTLTACAPMYLCGAQAGIEETCRSVGLPGVVR